MLVMLSLFGSMFLAILAFKDIPKYNSPFLFTFAVGLIGAAVGYFVWKKVKPIVFKYSMKKHDDGTMSTFVIMTIIGFSIFTVNKMNTSSSYKTNCDSYKIVNKYREESGFRKPAVNTLVVNLSSKSETVICDNNQWLKKGIGDTISLCFYESVLGFNYIEINE